MQIPINALLAAYQSAMNTALTAEWNSPEYLVAMAASVKIGTLLNRIIGSVEISDNEASGCRPFLSIETSEELVRKGRFDLGSDEFTEALSKSFGAARNTAIKEAQLHGLDEELPPGACAHD